MTWIWRVCCGLGVMLPSANGANTLQLSLHVLWRNKKTWKRREGTLKQKCCNSVERQLALFGINCSLGLLCSPQKFQLPLYPSPSSSSFQSLWMLALYFQLFGTCLYVLFGSPGTGDLTQPWRCWISSLSLVCIPNPALLITIWKLAILDFQTLPADDLPQLMSIFSLNLQHSQRHKFWLNPF